MILFVNTALCDVIGVRSESMTSVQSYCQGLECLGEREKVTSFSAFTMFFVVIRSVSRTVCFYILGDFICMFIVNNSLSDFIGFRARAYDLCTIRLLGFGTF